MKLKLSAIDSDRELIETLVLCKFQGEPFHIAKAVLDARTIDFVNRVIQDQSDCDEYGNTIMIPTSYSTSTKRVLVLGLGTKDKLTVDKIRCLSAIMMQAVLRTKSHNIAMYIRLEDLPHWSADDLLAAITEGSILGTYRFGYYKNDKKNQQVDKLIIIGKWKNQSNSAKCVTNAQIIADSVNFARDLVNHPSSYMTPTQMAKKAVALAESTGIEVSVLDKIAMEKQKMNALLAVARGSTEPPQMIVLKYTGNIDSKEYIAFIGKGITFDSGGISLKPSVKLDDMKDDMAGGAAVLGAMRSIGRLKPRSNVIGLIPCAENMPSGNAFKPGDIITSMDGKTIEIISTDAEGRLILADAITYARKLGAVKLVDVATLTGACMVALGSVASGVVTNDSVWCSMVMQAAEQTGEKMWQLPHYDEYLEQIKSDIADLKNSGGRMAGVITAGLFLKQFVGDTSWVHIDIAGTANVEKSSGYTIKGATGVGVRTLIQLAKNIGVQ